MSRFISIALMVFLSFSASSLFAASKEITGEGRFYALEDDNLNFVKKQLLFSAYEDIITKELDTLGLDSKLFWRQFNEQFEKSFIAVEQELKTKYPTEQTAEMTKTLTDGEKKRNLEEYNKNLRLKRLTMRTRFQNLAAVITQYKVKVMSRSTQFPKSRYLKVTAKVDDKELNSIYHRLTSVSSARQYKRLIISTKFLPQGTNWSDIGVEVPSEFEGAISKGWQTWLQNNLSSYVQEIRLATSDDEKEMQDFFKLTDQAKDSVSLATMDSNPLYTGVLWLQLSFNIKKKSSNALQGTRGFLFTGDYVLTDLGSNKVLAFADFSRPVKNFSYEKDHLLRSAVASEIHSIPIEQFVTIKNLLSSNSGNMNHAFISVDNVNNLNGLFKLEKLLSAKGVTLQLASQVISIKKNKAQLRIDIAGDLAQLTQLLLGLHQQEVEDVIVVVKDRSKPFELSLQQISEAKNEP